MFSKNQRLMVNLTGLILSLGLGILWLYYNNFQTAARPAAEPVKTTEVWLADHRLAVEIANTPESRRRGLSGRESLEENRGMFFVFDQPGVYGFWMREMNFPVDIIWLNADRQVIAVTEKANPESFPRVFYPPQAVQYVLEVPAGWTETQEIKIGGRLSTNPE